MIKPIDAIRNELPVVTSKTLDLFESAVSQELQKKPKSHIPSQHPWDGGIGPSGGNKARGSL